MLKITGKWGSKGRWNVNNICNLDILVPSTFLEFFNWALLKLSQSVDFSCKIAHYLDVELMKSFALCLLQKVSFDLIRLFLIP